MTVSSSVFFSSLSQEIYFSRINSFKQGTKRQSKRIIKKASRKAPQHSSPSYSSNVSR